MKSLPFPKSHPLGNPYLKSWDCLKVAILEKVVIL